MGETMYFLCLKAVVRSAWGADGPLALGVRGFLFSSLRHQRIISIIRRKYAEGVLALEWVKYIFLDQKIHGPSYLHLGNSLLLLWCRSDR